MLESCCCHQGWVVSGIPPVPLQLDLQLLQLRAAGQVGQPVGQYTHAVKRQLLEVDWETAACCNTAAASAAVAATRGHICSAWLLLWHWGHTHASIQHQLPEAGQPSQRRQVTWRVTQRLTSHAVVQGGVSRPNCQAGQLWCCCAKGSCGLGAKGVYAECQVQKLRQETQGVEGAGCKQVLPHIPASGNRHASEQSRRCCAQACAGQAFDSQ
jgi:hypothetical protein